MARTILFVSTRCRECTILTQDTKVELGPEVQRKHLNIFMLHLKNSGYRKTFRQELLDSAYKSFEGMLEKDKLGVKPLYRPKPRTWNAEDRKNKKLKK